MFIGHFAVAFAAKKAAPRVSLGTLILSAAFLDAVWPVLVLLGVVAMLLFVPWSYWIDAHREVRSASAAGTAAH
jgi:hypothetical protein